MEKHNFKHKIKMGGSRYAISYGIGLTKTSHYRVFRPQHFWGKWYQKIDFYKTQKSDFYDHFLNFSFTSPEL